MIQSSHTSPIVPHIFRHVVCSSGPGLRPGMWSLVISTLVSIRNSPPSFLKSPDGQVHRGLLRLACLVVSMCLHWGQFAPFNHSLSSPGHWLYLLPDPGLPFRHLVRKGSSLSVPSYPGFGPREPVQAGSLCPCCVALGALRCPRRPGSRVGGGPAVLCAP